MEYLKNPTTKKAVFMAGWRDEETKNFVTFDGLNDKFGRNKFELSLLRNYWKGIKTPIEFPEINILLPATTILPNVNLSYHAVIRQNNQWQMMQDLHHLEFTWVLVKNDVYGNPLSMKYLGESNSVSFKAPGYAKNYRICLYVFNGKEVQIINSKLNPDLN